MKRIIASIAAVAVAVLTLVSCEKYEDGRPGKAARTEFAKMYPDAKDVEWEAEAGYWKVSFETGKAPDIKEHEAWYDADGNWLYTETDVLANALPQPVRDAIEASEYGASPIDDVNFVETPDGDFYRVEIKFGGLEISLDVTEDGEISLTY